jgi:hypothetical protein
MAVSFARDNSQHAGPVPFAILGPMGKGFATMGDMAFTGARMEAGDLVGRERELRELRHVTSGTRALTLCGPGGIGKTRLLLALVASLAPGYPDGTFVVRLSDLRRPALVVSEMAAAIGVSDEPTVMLAETLSHALRGRRMLLALDGCEHLTEECASLCQRLLACGPGLTVLAASRLALGMAGETVWPGRAYWLPARSSSACASGSPARVRPWTRCCEQ